MEQSKIIDTTETYQYLDKILKEFKMDQSKKEFLPEL